MKHNRPTFYVQLMSMTLLVMLSLPGCGLYPAAAPPIAPPVEAAPASIGPTDTPVLAPIPPTAASPPDPAVDPTSAPTQYPEPLRFTFPTAGSDPISQWRPPLYPIPWEPTPNDHFYFMRPIGANEVNWPLARYRYGGTFFEDTTHTGIDIPAPKGTPVLAAGPGKVIWAGYGLFFLREEFQDPYGLAIAIEHDFGYQGEPIYTVYGHMDEIFAFRGQRVETNQVIGLTGETGKVTGPHLHFEVRLRDNKAYGSRNPELWISPPQGWGVLAGRVMGDSGGLLEKKRVHLRNRETNQNWFVITYAKTGSNPDPYYNENVVIGDLPEGSYTVWIEHNNTVYSTDLEIQAGMVTYFTYVGKFGFEVGLPPTPAPEFVPPDATQTPTVEK
jgi:murein DD-endopeptidase MepM/ murein hydrolase activator NlpD